MSFVPKAPDARHTGGGSGSNDVGVRTGKGVVLGAEPPSIKRGIWGCRAAWPHFAKQAAASSQQPDADRDASKDGCFSDNIGAARKALSKKFNTNSLFGVLALALGAQGASGGPSGQGPEASRGLWGRPEGFLDLTRTKAKT